MNYPLISEYIEAIRSAEDNFDKLSNLRPVLDNNGNPIMSSGNFAVVFKMQDIDTGRFFAVKCFIKEQEGRDERYAKITEELQYVSSLYILHVRYLNSELYVDTTVGSTKEFPVLLMDWIDGQPLDAYLREHIQDEYARLMLAYRFCNMGAWLMSQPFAHGDLKPDNILVREDGSLVLVDYDGMFVPSMKGERAYEIGSPDFRHPNRTADDFDEHIDDFSIATIALSLKAIAIVPSLYGNFSTSDYLLFNKKDYIDIGESFVLKTIMSLASDSEIATLLANFLLAIVNKEIRHKLDIQLSEPKITKLRGFDSDVSLNDNDDSISDMYGVRYSKNMQKLLCGTLTEKAYTIHYGTKVIGDCAFFDSRIENIIIPNSLICIGDYAFQHCCSLRKINFTKYIKSIGDYAFCENSSLKSIELPEGINYIGNCAFLGCESLNFVSIPHSVLMIGEGAFSGCKSLKTVTINTDKFIVINDMLISSTGQLVSCWSNEEVINVPICVKNIGNYAFYRCESVKSIIIPKTISKIGDFAFSGCKCLQSIELPNNMISLGIGVFSGCESLQSINIPEGIMCIGDRAFEDCKNIQTILIPEGVSRIGNEAFSRCISLHTIKIQNGIKSIGEKVFYDCITLQSLNFPRTLTSIGGGVLNGCVSLTELRIDNSLFYEKDKLLISSDGHLVSCWSINENIELPNDVTIIDKYAFYGCKNIQIVNSSNRIDNIGKEAFCGCNKLETITIPNGVLCIDEYAFEGCLLLQNVNVPKGTKYNGNLIFKDCKSLLHLPKDYQGLEEMLYIMSI